MESVASEKKEVKTQVSNLPIQRVDAQSLIEQAIANNSSVETLERLFVLAKEIRSEQAREAWNRAMAEFQRNCPKILKTEKADFQSKTGRVRYTYAPLEEILRKVQPVMGPLGLSISWRNRIEKDHVVANCRISHEGGHHEESGEVAMPVQQGDLASSGPQRVGIAMTYALRYSLRSILGICPEDDPDAPPAAPPGDEESVPMPRRASEKPEGRTASEWTGSIKLVKTKAGSTEGRPWTKYEIVTEGGQEFFTFDQKIADFAKEAGKAPVSILWEPGAKGGRKILSIEPATE